MSSDGNALQEAAERPHVLTRRDIYGHGSEAMRLQIKFGAPGMWTTHPTYLELTRVGCCRKGNLLQLLRRVQRSSDSIREYGRSMNGLVAYLEKIPIAELLLAWEELNTTI